MSVSQPQGPPPQNRLVEGAFVLGREWRRYTRTIVVCAVVAGVVLAVWVFMPTQPKERVAPYREEPKRFSDTYTAPTPVVPVVAQQPLPKSPPPQPMIQTAPPPSPFKQMAAPVEMKEKQFSYTYNAGQLPPYLQKLTDQSKGAVAAAAPPTQGGIDFKPVTMAGTKSFTIPDRDLMLMRWSTILCVLDTAVVTGASGETPFRCHTAEAVRSPTGVVLMEAGTIVGGSYKSVVGEGDNRIIAVTAEAQTPNGVIAEIGGPIADGLGAAGVPGSVDEHWGQRIGGALVLALVDSAFSMAQSYIQRNSQNTNISLGNSLSGGGLSNLGQQLLAKTINIPPTITLNQGTLIQLWVTKYVDFSGSYKLEAVK